MRPRVDTCCSVVSLKVRNSYTRMAVEASISAMPLMSMMIFTNRRWRVIPLRSIASVLSNQRSQPEYFRTDHEIRGLCSPEVNPQADSVLFGDKLNHSSAVCKFIHVPDGQSICSFQHAQNLVELTGLRSANEEQM